MRKGSEFDERARAWDDAGRIERARQVADVIAAAIPWLSRARVLEYGAGTGLLGFALRDRAAHVTLADSSCEMLAVAREKIRGAGVANLTALSLDLTADPPPAICFDVVCSLLTLHHIPDVSGLLRTFHGMILPKGVLCIADLDAEDGSFHGAVANVHRGFERSALRGLVEAAGFADVRFQMACEIEKPPSSGRRYSVFLATARRP
ncbi:MAG TPA: class I SAM-dependent methyltransferase [Anaeromyxobacteraceae bacterium]|nr:class I SAM-dependent methyltransferase [Anaeromyxobacteraceae bacterium]